MVLHPPRARDGCAAPTADCRKALPDRSGCGRPSGGQISPQIASSSVTPTSRQILRRASFRSLAAVQTPQSLRRRLSIQAAQRACTHAVGGLKEKKALHAKGYLRQRYFRRATWSTKAFPEIVLPGSVKDLLRNQRRCQRKPFRMSLPRTKYFWYGLTSTSPKTTWETAPTTVG